MCTSIRKLYWTDGDNISIANTDGTNISLLFSNQKGPVGETPTEAAPPGVEAGEHTSVLCFFQVSPSTLKLSNFTGSAQETAPLTAVNWTALSWRCSKGSRAN